VVQPPTPAGVDRRPEQHSLGEQHGHIIAASHAMWAQRQDVNLRNSGALDIVRSSRAYGEATFTTAKKA
jgi:hypothetical protein